MIPERNPYNNWSGNGSTTTFDFDFYIENETQLTVYHTNAQGVQTLLKFGTDYSIDELKNENGSFITFPLSSSTYEILGEDEVISLCLSLPISQENPYGKSSFLDLKTLEYSLDYLTRICQIISRQLERSVKTQEGSSQSADELIEALQEAQVNATNSANAAAASATSANTSAIAAGEEATIATQKTAEVAETYQTAMTAISGAKIAAVGTIETAQANAESAILYDKEEALSSVATARTNAVNACESEVQKAKVYSEISGGKGMPTDICKKLNIEYDTENRKVKLKWKDPNDTVNSLGQIMSSWKGTVITCKNGSYPENFDDGTIIADSKIRNQYLNQELIYDVPVTVTDISQLRFKAFPYSVNGVYNKDEKNCFDNTIVYEFLYDSKNSNVKGSISYPEGCANEFFKSMKMDNDKNIFDYGSWGDTFIMQLVKPCMLYNQNAKDDEGNSLCGQIMEMLNPDDYSKTTDGSPSNVANENCNANAMAQWHIKNLWFKIEEYLPKKYHVYIANKQVDENYKNLLRFNKNGEIRDYYYRAMYDACNINNILRSISGKAPCVNVAGNTQIAYARANGEGYDVDEARFIFTRNLLLMLMGKSPDTQAVFGTGRHSGGSNTNYNQLTSGQLNNKGAFFSAGENMANKVFHSENPWGNVWKITQGILQSGGKLYLKLTPNINDGTTLTDYPQTSVAGCIDTGIVLSGTSGGYISEVALAAGSAFLPSVISGSSSTFIPDGGWWNASIIGFARCGGSSINGLLCGSFALLVYYAVSHADWSYGASLSYTPS